MSSFQLKWPALGPGGDGGSLMMLYRFCVSFRASPRRSAARSGATLTHQLRLCKRRSHRVCAAADAAAGAGPVAVEELATRLVHAFVGVRAEVIALGLEQVRGQAFAAEAVEERQRGAERRHGDAFAHGGAHHLAPTARAALDRLLEE